MSKTVKIILITGTLLVILIAAAALLLYNMMSRGTYQAGQLAQGKGVTAPLEPPLQSGDPDFWSVEEGIQLYHFASGEGRNLLVVHGGPGYPTRGTWLGLDQLSDEYQAHFYDQRGCGDSSRPIDRLESRNTYENMTHLEGALGLGTQLADIERIRRILGEERLVLVGHSFGGFLATLYAAEFPDKVEALVLVSPADMLVMPQAEDSDLFSLVRERLPEPERAGFDAFMQDYLDFNHLFENSEADLVQKNRDLAEYFSQAYDLTGTAVEAEPGGWMVWGMYNSMGVRHDYRAALANVTAPVLVIHGANDLQSPAVSEQYATLLPNATLQVIDGASHFSFNEQPEAFAQAVRSFLEDQ